jgi:hypothetical protein
LDRLHALGASQNGAAIEVDYKPFLAEVPTTAGVTAKAISNVLR